MRFDGNQTVFQLFEALIWSTGVEDGAFTSYVAIRFFSYAIWSEITSRNWGIISSCRVLCNSSCFSGITKCGSTFCITKQNSEFQALVTESLNLQSDLHGECGSERERERECLHPLLTSSFPLVVLLFNVAFCVTARLKQLDTSEQGNQERNGEKGRRRVKTGRWH